MNIWELLEATTFRKLDGYISIETPGHDGMILNDKNKLEFGLRLIEIAQDVLESMEVKND